MAYIRETIRQHYSSIDEFVDAAAAAELELQGWEPQAAAAAVAAAPAAAAAHGLEGQALWRHLYQQQ